MLIYNSVIAVPGYHTPPVRTWGMRSELEQAATSVNSISNLHMYIYEPTYESAEDFTWETFLKAGSDLAEELARLVTEVWLNIDQIRHYKEHTYNFDSFPTGP
jgi:hypothetical protein